MGFKIDLNEIPQHMVDKLNKKTLGITRKTVLNEKERIILDFIKKESHGEQFTLDELYISHYQLTGIEIERHSLYNTLQKLIKYSYLGKPTKYNYELTSVGQQEEIFSFSKDDNGES